MLKFSSGFQPDSRHSLSASIAYVAGFAGNALLIDEPERLRVVFDIEPVADVVALAVDRQLLADQYIEDSSEMSFSGKRFRVAGCGFPEEPFRAERTVNLVGEDMPEPERLAGFLPVAGGDVQQIGGPHDVGLHELQRVVD